ncbi:MAG: UDP-N-acetylglucosamine 1-carboxyvinyltransferase [Chloroflexi bacterium]|nr:MAG: UDP-N-acetylglucosamine 1-carboxyvinyltransferase [Chloroflexota bacterium]
MAKFIIEGGQPLHGTVTPSGNKNAALPILAASLLTDQPITLENVPRIKDVETMLQLLADLGAEVRWTAGNTLQVHAAALRKAELDPELCRRIRASILLAGPMLARAGHLTLPPPGGDIIGRRRVDTHILALRSLGAKISIHNNAYDMTANGLQGQDILLDEASVTGTENALMAAATAKGTTVIRNAASEPHVQDLARFLNTLGARISGIGSNTLVVEGVESLSGGHFRISADHIEVGSYIGLAAVCGDGVHITDAAPETLHMTRLVFRRLGVEVEIEGSDVYVPPHPSLRIVDDAGGAVPKIDDGPWPAFPADLMSIAIVVATQAQGTVLIHEKMFESRLYFVDKLISMGARIILCDPHRAVVVGPASLHGAPLESPDIRAGMALLIAALAADGKSVIRNIGQIDRGYENIDGKLRALGANIERVE